MKNLTKYLLLSLCFTSLFNCSGNKAEILNPGTATYLGNEGVMVSHGDTKVLFDPFFHNTFNTYQSVPEDIRESIFTGEAPYNSINAIFISHAHADHFSSGDLVKFLRTFPNTQLVAPKQAIDVLTDLEDANGLTERMHAIELAYKDSPVRKTMDKISYDVVRIPHAGWPQRAEVSNLVFRVTLNKAITVVHMGDADPDDEHFKPLVAHWDSQHTNTAFPPYWFMTSVNGQLILQERINADNNIGVHVPIAVPQELTDSGEKYYSSPGEKKTIKPVKRLKKIN